MIKSLIEKMDPLLFEEMCCDILNLEGLKCRTFPPGPDGGIDIECDNGQTIAQCKRVKNYSDLKSQIKKLKTLDNINRYIFFTSNELTLKNEIEILELLGEKFIVEKIELWGMKQLMEAINGNHLIKQKYLTPNILEELPFSEDITLEITKRLENIELNKETFHPTKIFHDCYDRLKKMNILLIIGDPGIGKTVTSEMLFAKFTEAGYCALTCPMELLSTLSNELVKFNENEKYIILIDDILGHRKFEKEKCNTHSIEEIIKKVEKTNNIKLIINTRITIFEEYKHYNVIDSLSTMKASAKYLINLNKMDEIDKIQIILNHAKKNGVKKKSIDTLIEKDVFFISNKKKSGTNCEYNYEVIINGAKPFAIRPIVKAIEKKNYNKKFYELLISFLENPSLIWDDEYQEFSDTVKKIIFIFRSFGDTPITYEIVNECAKKIDVYEADVNKALKKLETSWIKENENGKMKFTNPSIYDFIQTEKYMFDKEKILLYVEQIIDLEVKPTRELIKKLKKINNEKNEVLYSRYTLPIEPDEYRDILTSDCNTKNKIIIPGEFIEEVIEKEGFDVFENSSSYLKQKTFEIFFESLAINIETNEILDVDDIEFPYGVIEQLKTIVIKKLEYKNYHRDVFGDLWVYELAEFNIPQKKYDDWDLDTFNYKFYDEKAKTEILETIQTLVLTYNSDIINELLKSNLVEKIQVIIIEEVIEMYKDELEDVIYSVISDEMNEYIEENPNEIIQLIKKYQE